jgi:3-oxoacyl-[acyl-carrier protein] reductase
MELGLRDRVAIVSGASVGLGRAVATAFAAEGVRVVAVARREKLLEDLRAEVASAGGADILPLVVDVTAPDAPARVVAAAQQRFGRLDILVNNAGGSRPTVWDAPEEVWRESMELNFHAVRRLSQEVVPVMQGAGWGRIINVTGASEPRDVNAASPAKAAVHIWSKGLSRMVAPDGITVNCVPPGRIHSEQVDERLHPTAESRDAFVAANVPLGRLGEAEEFADVVLFLASDAARYVTGQILHVDGGMRRFAF